MSKDAHTLDPWAFIKAIDPTALALYVTKRLTIEKAMERLGRKMDLPVAAVRMSAAEAAIDVDKPDDLALVRRIAGSRILPAD